MRSPERGWIARSSSRYHQDHARNPAAPQQEPQTRRAPKPTRHHAEKPAPPPPVPLPPSRTSTRIGRREHGETPNERWRGRRFDGRQASVPSRRSSSVEDSRPARIERTTCIRSTQCVSIRDQLIAFSPGAEQLVDVLVADVGRVTVEREVLPVPDAGQQISIQPARGRASCIKRTLKVRFRS